MKKIIDYQKGERFSNATSKASILTHTDAKDGQDVSFNQFTSAFEVLRDFSVTVTLSRKSGKDES